MSISSPLVVTVGTAEGCEPGCVPKECKITLSLANNMVTLKSTAKIINVFFIIIIFIVANLDSLESSHKKMAFKKRAFYFTLIFRELQ